MSTHARKMEMIMKKLNDDTKFSGMLFDSADVVDNASGALAYWEKVPDSLTIMWRKDTCQYFVAPMHIAHGCVKPWVQTSPEEIETFLNS